MDSSTDQRKTRSVWIIPFSALAIVLMIAIVDLLLALNFLELNHQIWMWAFSSLITVVVASLVTELVSLNNKRAIFSLTITGFVSMLIYFDIAVFLRDKVVSTIQSVIPSLFLSNILYALIMILLPGVTIGGIIGVVIGVFPKGKNKHEKRGSETKNRIEDFEKYCERCGYTYPFDSSFCPFCGVPLSKRPIPLMRFCRYCGRRIFIKGKHCPECGREIILISRPEIYTSK